jgi:RNA polymerase sigma-70 factor (ECF subfamily)
MADGPTDNASAKALLIAAIPRVRRFAYALTGAPDAADDLTQTTLERALAQIERFEPGTRMESWLMRIAYNAAVDEARRRKRRGPHLDVDDLVDVSGGDGRRDMVARLDLAAARTAMARLPEDQRAVLALVALDGMSYQEAAETLEIPIGTVMSRLSRARRAVARAVDGQGDTP